MASQEINQQQEAWIKSLAAKPVEQAAAEIHTRIQQDVGAYGQAAVEAAEQNIKNLVARYKEEHAVHVTGFADVLVREKVGASVTTDAKGKLSYGVNGQTHLGEVAGMNVFAGGSLGADQSSLTGGSAWVNGIGKPFDIGDTHVIPVSQLAVNVPADGKVGLGNVSGMVGAVINPDGTHGNVAALLSATADGKSAGAFVDYSHDFQFNNATVTPHLGVTQQFLGDRDTVISGGVRAHDPHFFNKTTGLAFELSGASGNVRSKEPGWSIGAQVEVTFNNAPKKDYVTELDEALKHATQKSPVKDHLTEAGKSPSAPLPKPQPILTAEATENTRQAAGDLRYNFLDLSKHDQKRVLTLMASAYKKANPDLTMQEARSEILDRLAASNYLVNNHGTPSYRDDVPEASMQVASR